MQQARNICRHVHGVDKEASLHAQYGADLDEYVYHACNEAGGGGGILCKQCKTNSAVVEMLQTRSGDEGMTAFVVCQKCRHRRHFG